VATRGTKAAKRSSRNAVKKDLGRQRKKKIPKSRQGVGRVRKDRRGKKQASGTEWGEKRKR